MEGCQAKVDQSIPIEKRSDNLTTINTKGTNKMSTVSLKETTATKLKLIIYWVATPQQQVL